ncbi:MAG: class II glutamine amidotransferase [Polyangiaceae bacterium]
MCRLLGIIASEPTEFRLVLRDVPRSLAALSREHPDGWGLAVYDEAVDWRLHKGVACATEDEHFHRHAAGSRGNILISHVRRKTVGPTSLDNTHPFESSGWVFAHNGTITDTAYLREQASVARSQAMRGETDSELFFAYLLSRFDRAGATKASEVTDGIVREVVHDAWTRPNFGAFNFLLSDGHVTYAHRFGRGLFLLERGPHDEVRGALASKDGSVVETPWSQRRRAVFIASEKMTDEPWIEIEDRTLLRVDRSPIPVWRRL